MRAAFRAASNFQYSSAFVVDVILYDVRILRRDCSPSKMSAFVPTPLLNDLCTLFGTISCRRIRMSPNFSTHCNFQLSTHSTLPLFDRLMSPTFSTLSNYSTLGSVVGKAHLRHASGLILEEAGFCPLFVDA